MKRIYFLLSVLCFFVVTLSAQNSMEDVVYLKNGSIIHGTIIEQVPNKSIKVKTKDGSVFVYNMTDVEKLTKEQVANTYSRNSVSGNQFANVSVPSYKLIKQNYNPQMYIPQPSDPYNPTVSGVCSFFIPGLGQMISGEVGRGLGFLGGSIGCGIIAGIGGGIAYYSDLGTIMALVGYAGMLSLDIYSIVDAVKVAKVKNMYVSDQNNRTSMNFEIAPYVDQLAINNQRITPVGLTMRVKF